MTQPSEYVFISYARADNIEAPTEEKPIGWVSFFWLNLKYELTMLGAANARLWIDRYEIDPAEAFTPKIEAAVRSAAVLLPVFSENWANSDWCRREIDEFAKAHGDARVRLVPVYKSELDRELLPPILSDDDAAEGYRFFAQDSEGNIQHFYWRRLNDEVQYLARVQKVANYIRKLLKEVTPIRGTTALDDDAPRVFVAETARELNSARQRLANDLAGAGFRVVPDVPSLPDVAADYEARIRADLAASVHAVVLLGESPGDTLADSIETILQLSLRVAREVGSPDDRRLSLWVPRWLPGLADKKREPFEVLARWGGLQTGEEVFSGEVTDLSQWLRQRLDRRRSAGANTSVATGPVIITSADAGDDDLVFDLASQLQGLSRPFRPLESTSEASTAGGSATVILLWGKASPDAIDNRLRSCSSSICLILPDGDAAAKRRFFREGVVATRLNALPADPRAARELAARLGLLSDGAA